MLSPPLQDRIIWDVGHQVSLGADFFVRSHASYPHKKYLTFRIFSVQAYPHKMLTGRRDRMDTMRQTNGACKSKSTNVAQCLAHISNDRLHRSVAVHQA